MLIDISPKGELLSDATRRSDIVTTSTKMEKTKESIEKALNLLNIQRKKKEIILKEEQEKAVVELLSGKGVLAILPTGFGKSCNIWIFEEIAKFLFQIITTKSTHVAGGSFFESWPAF